MVVGEICGETHRNLQRHHGRRCSAVLVGAEKRDMCEAHRKFRRTPLHDHPLAALIIYLGMPGASMNCARAIHYP